MIDGTTGLLAMTIEEWVSCLTYLIRSAELRHRLGEAARVHVLTHHTTRARAAHFAAIISRVASGADAPAAVV
jgi:spore maturation protein CgeB